MSRFLLCLVLLVLSAPAYSQNGPPSITPHGIVSAASFTAPLTEAEIPTAVLSSGSLVSIFGQNLATGTFSATTLPLPTTLGSTSVLFVSYPDSVKFPVHVLYVSPTQINLQVPTGFQGPGRNGYGSGSFLIQVGTQETTSDYVLLIDSVPAMFTARGSDQMVAYLVSARSGAVIGPQNSVEPGEVVTLYLLGLGPARGGLPGGSNISLSTIIIVPDGQPAPLSPPYQVYTTPQVSVGLQSATVLFAGLAPGYVGLDQVNFVIPANAPEGCRVPLTITGDHYTSPTTYVSIRKGGGACQD